MEADVIAKQEGLVYKEWGEKKDSKVENESKKFVARDYQIEMLNVAKTQNTIVMMPTGSGKTYVAVLLIQYYAYQLMTNSDNDKNWKRTFFLVNQVTLVTQQAKVLREHTGLTVGQYSAKHKRDIDRWNERDWEKEFKENHVFVLVAEIFKQLLSTGFLKPSHVNVLVLDECHHAKKNHNMAQIMKDYWVPAKATGRVLGLTASAIDKKNCSPSELKKEIDTLSLILQSRLVTPREFTNQLSDVVLPSRELEIYSNKTYGEELLVIIHNLEDTVKDPQIYSTLPREHESTMKTVRQIVNTIVLIVKEIGVDALLTYIPDSIKEIENKITDPLIAPIVGRDGTVAESERCLLFTVCENIIQQLDKVNQTTTLLLEESREVKMSIKFFKLIKYIIELQRSSDKDNPPRIVIFIERRRIVETMYNYMWKLREEVASCAAIKPAYILGGSSGRSAEGEMDHEEEKVIKKQQEKALSDFRDGKANILIATSVVEEGMDIPACNVVIRYDFPPTYRAYVQSRGRARKRPAKFVFYIEEREEEELQKNLDSYDEIEKLLKNYTAAHFTPEFSDGEDEDEDVIPSLRVADSGAMVTPSMAIQRLNFYCSQLPKDMYTDTNPIEETSRLDEHPELFLTTLTMPKLSPLARVTGEPMPSKKLAKVSAAMQALKELYVKKELTDALLPQFRQKEHNTLKFVEETGRCLTVDQKIKIPSIFWRKNLLLSSKFYLYSISLDLKPKVDNFSEYFTQSPYHKIKCFGILSKDPLPEYPAFDIYPRYGTVTVHIKFEREMAIPTAKVLPKYQWFQEALFTHVLDVKNVQVADNFLFKNYLVLPLCYKNRGGAIRKRTKDTTNVYLDVDNLFIETLFKRWDPHKKNWIYGDIPTDFQRCVDCVIFQNYRFTEGQDNSIISSSNALYIVADKSDTLTASSLMKDKDGEEKQSYKEYHEEKYHVELQYPDDPLLQCRYVSRRYNMLQNREEKYDKNLGFYLRETHQVHPMPASLWNQATCLPSILWRIETMTLSYELYSTMQFENEIASPLSHIQEYFKNYDKIDIKEMLRRDIQYTGPVDYIEHLQPITHKSCRDGFDLERLEFLGDKFLKMTATMFYYRTMPDKHEGWLSKFKSQMVSNENLAVRSSQTIGLPRFILNKNIQPQAQWIPPCFLPTSTLRGISTRPDLEEYLKDNEVGSAELLLELCELIPEDHKQSLQEKDIADCAEALIGLYLNRYGYRVALSLLDKIHITKFHTPAGQPPQRLADVLYQPTPRSQVRDLPSIKIQRAVELGETLTPLENILKYKFKDRMYLVEAVLHASYSDLNVCYQRLEFLGDAVLDILIVTQVYQNHPHYHQGEMTDLLASLVCNTTLSKICTNLGLHSYLKYDSPELYNILTRFYTNCTEEELEGWCSDYSLARVFTNSVDTDEPGNIPTIDLDYKIVQTPKILGDIVESVIGAIYLDSGECFQTVWDVIWPWFEHYYQHYSVELPKNPRALLYEHYPRAIHKEIRAVDEYRCKGTVTITPRDNTRHCTSYTFNTVGRDNETTLDVCFERAWKFHVKYLSKGADNELEPDTPAQPEQH